MSLFGHHRDDRRRRVLAEELAGDASATADAAPKAAVKIDKTQRYTDAAKRENHRPATDLVPRRVLPLVLWYLFGLALAGGLMVGVISPAKTDLANTAGVGQLLDASQGGSLAGWFSSLTFILSAVGCVLIYSVRRHKLDDYRGRYRLWLWCAAAWIAMSIDATANLHAPFSRAMAKATGWSALPDGAVWWIAVWGLILSVLSLRLIFEVRDCSLAMLAIIGVGVLWLTALACDYGWIPSSFPLAEHAATLAIGCRLIGQVTLLLAVGAYCRHVLLDAEGLLKVRPPKPKREKPAKKEKAEKQKKTPSDLDSDAPPKSTRIDSGHKTVGYSGSSNSGNSASGSSGSSLAASSYGTQRYQDEDRDDDNRSSNRRSGRNNYEEDGDDSYGNKSKLSKAERKRIRKMMRQQEREDDR